MARKQATLRGDPDPRFDYRAFDKAEVAKLESAGWVRCSAGEVQAFWLMGVRRNFRGGWLSGNEARQEERQPN